jgi:hypothetical protein
MTVMQCKQESEMSGTELVDNGERKIVDFALLDLSTDFYIAMMDVEES